MKNEYKVKEVFDDFYEVGDGFIETVGTSYNVSASNGVTLIGGTEMDMQDAEGLYWIPGSRLNVKGKSVYSSVVKLERVEKNRYEYRIIGTSYIFDGINLTPIKGTYIKEVTSTNPGAYPDNGVSGSYWYEKQ